MIRISFGIIALNAQPLLEYNLRALYPFAHQIIVVEGATRAAASLATREGHSTDDTLQMLEHFRATAGENKIQIVSAADEGYTDGFWPEKDEMSRAYSKRANGDWLWQVDSDEFYEQEDMQAIVAMLSEQPDITAVSFPYFEFFGGFSSVITGKWHLVEYPRLDRLFRWGAGFSYKSHRPPTVVDSSEVDLRSIKWISAPAPHGKAIKLFHYSYVFPKQARQKVGYYSNVSWTDAFRKNQTWLEDSFLKLKHPFFLSERGWPILQWLERYRGKHPYAIEQLRADLASGKTREPQRSSDDIEKLLKSPVYNLATGLLKLFMPSYWKLRQKLNRWSSRRKT